MIELSKLSVYRNKPDSLDLVWEFKDTEEDLSDYEISVYVSQAPSEDISEYTLVDSGLSATAYAYEDFTVSGLAHGTRQWYYRLDILNTATQSSSITDYHYVNSERPNRKWLKIWNDKNLAISKKSGRDFLLLKRRTWGTRSEVSWDPILFVENTEEDPNANTWGTGWVDGYFDPQKLLGMITPAAQVKDPTLWGEFYPSDVVLTMLNRPPLEIGDIIVDVKTDDRYYVQRVRTLDMLGVPIEQQAQLSLIHISDEIYSFPVEAYK